MLLMYILYIVCSTKPTLRTHYSLLHRNSMDNQWLPAFNSFLTCTNDFILLSFTLLDMLISFKLKTKNISKSSTWHQYGALNSMRFSCGESSISTKRFSAIQLILMLLFVPALQTKFQAFCLLPFRHFCYTSLPI